jgi:hypothetical protein
VLSSAHLHCRHGRTGSIRIDSIISIIIVACMVVGMSHDISYRRGGVTSAVITLPAVL